MSMTMNTKPMKYEFITALSRLYIAENYSAAVSVMPLTENKINFNVLYGMAGTTFTIDLSRHIHKSVDELYEFVTDKIDRKLK